MAEKKEKQYVSDNAQLMTEWNWEKNKELEYDPTTLTLGSKKKVWWKCSKGHEWEMPLPQRVRGQGCPYCSNHRVWVGYNDLKTTHPEIAKQWDLEKNLDIDLNSVTYGSNKTVWWKCPLGHSYQMPVHKKCARSALSCPICSGHKTVAGINDFETCYPDIAKEWHPTKNKLLTPSEISRKNGKKVWWLCRYGHEWQATPKDRVNDNTGCPICSARRLTSFPEQAIYYYVKKLYPDAVNRCKDVLENGMELDIYIPSLRLGIEFDGARWHNSEEVHRRERDKYLLCQNNGIKLLRVKEHTGNQWWDVADDNYIIHKKKNRNDLATVIQVILNSIDPTSNMWTRKDPRCIHSRIHVNLERDENAIRAFLTAIPNSLVELRPDVAEEWHPTKNGTLTPNMFGVNSNDSAWWKCKNCGHEWRTSIIHRGGKRNSGCPECSKKQRGKTFTQGKVAERGSLAENNPELAKQWHPTKNGNLTPNDITAKRFKKVWWLCPVCGHEWESSPNDRSQGKGCPCCSGRVPKIGTNDFQTLFPEISTEWDYTKNTPLTPNLFLPKSGKKVWWKCKDCGHEWQTEIRLRSNGHGCPQCARKRKKQE